MMLRLREQITAHLHVVALVSKVYVDIMLTTFETERLLVMYSALLFIMHQLSSSAIDSFLLGPNTGINFPLTY